MFETSDVELFLDDAPIAATIRLTRVWERPRKFGPVIRPDRPWEGHCVIVYGSVLPRPGGGYQAWYQTFSRHVRGPERAVFCYAESDDGVNWRKPELGLCDWRGSTANNIIHVARAAWLSTLSVIVDRDEPDESRRYKMLYSANEEGPGLYAGFSSDGIRWTFPPQPVCTEASDRTTLLHDPGAEFPYVAYTRRHGALMMGEFRGRVVYRSASRDFAAWSTPEPVLVPDLGDHWDVQFYGLPAFRYRQFHLGGLKRLWSTPDRIDTELVFSRDGISWGRSRETFLENGTGDAWDRLWIALASSPPLDMGRDLWFYHEGRDSAHDGSSPFPNGAIGLAVMRKDRFCALEAGNEGIVTTTPVAWDGGRLLLNVRPTGPGASVRVELLNDAGAPIPGFAYADAVDVGGDSIDGEVKWSANSSLDALRGRRIMLRVYLRQARLYAIERRRE